MYRAKVLTRFSDDSIIVTCPALYGSERSGRIPAAVPASPPTINSVVWIALENNDQQKPIWLPLGG